MNIKNMDEYAYKKVPAQYEDVNKVEYNDWKEKREGMVTHHPLLVSSSLKRGLSKENWEAISGEQVESLDDLDKVSYEIYLWYKKIRKDFIRNLKKV